MTVVEIELEKTLNIRRRRSRVFRMLSKRGRPLSGDSQDPAIDRRCRQNRKRVQQFRLRYISLQDRSDQLERGGAKNIFHHCRRTERRGNVGAIRLTRSGSHLAPRPQGSRTITEGIGG